MIVFIELGEFKDTNESYILNYHSDYNSMYGYFSPKKCSYNKVVWKGCWTENLRSRWISRFFFEIGKQSKTNPLFCVAVFSLEHLIVLLNSNLIKLLVYNSTHGHKRWKLQTILDWPYRFKNCHQLVRYYAITAVHVASECAIF
jgi:hypothetical protein